MRRITVHNLYRFLILCLTIGFASESYSQSNYDLEPPMQADTNSQQVLMSPDPNALPVFKFATAEISDGKVIVSTTKVQQKLVAPMPGSTKVSAELDPRGIRRVENVQQNYTVSVPYTETLGDGKQVTRMRTETRTRTVPMTRYRKRNAEEQAEHEKAIEAKKKEEAKAGKKKPEVKPATYKMVSQPYVISIPYTEVVDGKPTARVRTETRLRDVQVLHGKTETTGKPVSESFKISEVKAYSVAGKELDEATTKDRMADRSPVILINNANAISPYFRSILKPETVFLVLPKAVKP